MKLSTNTVFLFFGIIGLGIMQSCSDDNEDPNPSTTAPTTLTYSHIDNMSFKIWNDGAEVNTDGLSIEDYIDPDYYDELTEEYYQSQPGLTFKGDSLFSESDGMIVGLPYHISNDSIILTVTYIIEGQAPIVADQLFAMGNQTELYIPRMYYRAAQHTDSSNMYIGSFDIGHYTLDAVLEQNGIFDSIDNLQENDSIIIYNQRAYYN